MINTPPTATAISCDKILDLISKALEPLPIEELTRLRGLLERTIAEVDKEIRVKMRKLKLPL